MQQNVRRFIYQSGCPVTMTLIAIYVVTFFLYGGGVGAGFLKSLVFYGDDFPRAFWTASTWPLVGIWQHPLNILFGGMWAYNFCGSLERGWGSKTFVNFFFSMAAITAATYWVGQRLLGGGVPIYGLWPALAAPTVAWCAVNRRESICVWFVTIPAPYLAALAFIVLWFDLGGRIIGLFGLSGCLIAWWYAERGRFAFAGYATRRNPFSRGGGRPKLRMDHVDRESAPPAGLSGWWKARQERRKLEQLWKRSGLDAKERDNRR